MHKRLSTHILPATFSETFLKPSRSLFLHAPVHSIMRDGCQGPCMHPKLEAQHAQLRVYSCRYLQRSSVLQPTAWQTRFQHSQECEHLAQEIINVHLKETRPAYTRSKNEVLFLRTASVPQGPCMYPKLEAQHAQLRVYSFRYLQRSSVLKPTACKMRFRHSQKCEHLVQKITNVHLHETRPAHT